MSKNVDRPYNIGVFDSGVGGEAVARVIKQHYPQHNIVYVSDDDNVPYGDKSIEQLRALVLPIMRKLAEHVDVIVVACNTVSTLLVAELRRELPSTPFVALEPMVKPAAAMTKSGVVAVCATPATLKSSRYAELKNLYTKGVTVLEPDCSNWSAMIQSSQVNKEQIQEQVDDMLSRQADVIVLGCTHYHWIESLLQKRAGEQAVVLQPEQPVIRQLERVLAQLD